MNIKYLNFICGLTFTCINSPVNAQVQLMKDEAIHKKSMEIFAELLYLQPSGSNQKYAVFVSGQQPRYQSWHYQEIKPDYSPAFALGLHYNLAQTPYQATIDWLHLDTSDSTFKQASQNTNLTTVEFVAPNYDVGPAVFGIKRADANIKFDFNNININAGKLLHPSEKVHAKLYSGLNVLRLNEKATTVFSDYPGTPPTLYSYALPPDPVFTFQTQNISKYTGVGPELGLDLQYNLYKGFGIAGNFLGSITAGRMRVVDNFRSTSSQLIAQGIPVSYQQITTPDTTRVVSGFDSKLGLFYRYEGERVQRVTFEAGYRIALYYDAIADINPSSLVQAGVFAVTPEFATGTMAINATDARNRNFSVNGPYANLKIAFA